MTDHLIRVVLLPLVLLLTIAAGLPAQKATPSPTAKPKQAKVLILTGNEYPGHKWRETAPLLAKFLAEDPRLKTVVEENPAFLASPDLHGYDAIVLNYLYGKGRVFLCVLGHDVKALSFKDVQELYRRGTAWSAGLAPAAQGHAKK
jgi:hypothetical protein